MTRLRALLLTTVTLVGTADAAPSRRGPSLPEGETAWRDSGNTTIRGVTVGPIETALHPGKGYGSEPCARTMAEVRALGGGWVSITPFGRVWDLAPSGVDPTFEAPFEENRKSVARAIDQAHAEGLRVLLVPHLWVETGAWRALIDPGDDEAWAAWAARYGQFIERWARVAEASRADMLSVGVELRSWVTTTHAPLFLDVIARARQAYSGLVTYAANWDDVEDTVILGALDVIGVNAFFPLAERAGADVTTLHAGGKRVAARMRALSKAWHKPILFTEIGYTTRPDPAVEPWTWPDGMTKVRVDQAAQADATAALLEPLVDEPWFAGFFVWRVYADPDDLSQEAEWGFSPRGKLAESVLREAFARRWAGDGLFGPEAR